MVERLSKMSSRAQAGRGYLDLRSRSASEQGSAGRDVGAIRNVSRAIGRAGISTEGVRLYRTGGHAAVSCVPDRLAARSGLPGGGNPAQERLLRRLRRCQMRKMDRRCHEETCIEQLTAERLGAMYYNFRNLALKNN